MFKAAPSACVVVAEKFVDLLQKCRQKKDLPRAKQLLASIREQHLEDHGVVGNFLVPTLVDCGGLHDAQLVFDRLPYRNVYSWTSLMLGYVGSGDPHHAFCLYHSMLRDCVPPNHHTFLALLRACHGLKGDPLELSVHADIVKCGLDRDGFLGNSLVGAYGKRGLLAEALQVFATLSDRDVVSWNALIAGYVDHGLCEEALGCLEQMQQEGPSPDDVTFVGSLKACGSAGDTEKGHLLCIQIIKRGLESNVIVVNALVDMYARCGQLAEACQIFDHLPVRNIVSWNTIITAYTEVGLGEEAASCFNQMQLENVSPDEVTFACTLKVCGSLGAIEQGQILCAEIVMRGYEKSLLVGNTIIAMYAKCGLLAEAREVFASLPDQCVVSWNALITAYTEHGLGLDAISCFKQMELEGRFPDEATFISTLKACCFANDLGTGQDIHIKLSKRGLERDPHIGSSMVDMYSKCGSLIEAYQVFEKLRARDEVLWNTMISGFVEHGLGEETLNCYEKMQLERVIPVVVTYVCCLKACGITGAVETGQQLHTEIARRGMEGVPSVGNTLVDRYGKCGLLAEGHKMFDMLSVQNVVSWNVVIMGYAEQGEFNKVCNLVAKMQEQGGLPDSTILVSMLKAYANTAASQTGQELHKEMVKFRLKKETFLGNMLVHMYSKCGFLPDAQKIFDMLPVRELDLWTALIVGLVENGFHMEAVNVFQQLQIEGYPQHGLDEEVLKCFKKMQLQGVSMSDLTLVASLRACGTTGALEIGREVHAHIRKSGLERDFFMGNTLVDMYGTCGSVKEAHKVFDNLHVQGAVHWIAMIKAYAEPNHDVQVRKYEQQESEFADAQVLLNVMQYGYLRTRRWNDAEIIYVFDPGGPLRMNACGTRGRAKYVMPFW